MSGPLCICVHFVTNGSGCTRSIRVGRKWFKFPTRRYLLLHRTHMHITKNDPRGWVFVETVIWHRKKIGFSYEKATIINSFGRHIRYSNNGQKKSSVGKKCQNRSSLVTWSSDFATLRDWPFKGGRASEIVGSRVSMICNWNRGRIYGNELLFLIGIFGEWKNPGMVAVINERLAFECGRIASCCAFLLMKVVSVIFNIHN